MVTIEFSLNENNVLTKKTFGTLKKTDLNFYKLKFNIPNKYKDVPKVCYMRSLIKESYEPLIDNCVQIPSSFNGASKISVCLYLRLIESDLRTNTVMIDIEE